MLPNIWVIFKTSLSPSTYQVLVFSFLNFLYQLNALHFYWHHLSPNYYSFSLNWCKELLGDFLAFTLGFVFQPFSTLQTKLSPSTPLNNFSPIPAPRIFCHHLIKFFPRFWVAWDLATFQPYLVPLSPLGSVICLGALHRAVPISVSSPVSP